MASISESLLIFELLNNYLSPFYLHMHPVHPALECHNLWTFGGITLWAQEVKLSH